MYEQWHPLVLLELFQLSNFPVAVWSWNSMLAWVCGNVCVYGSLLKNPSCAVACQHIISKVFAATQYS